MKVVLRDIAKVKAGHPFRGAIKEDPDGNGYTIQVNDVDVDGYIKWDKLRKTHIHGRKEPEWLEPGNVIFIARGLKLTAAAIGEAPKHAICSPHFFIIAVLDTKVLPQFLAWQLNQTTVKRYFKKSAEGSFQVSIRRSVLEETPLIIPDLATQSKLVAIAACAFKEKQVLMQLIKNREQQLTTLAQNILNDRNT